MLVQPTYPLHVSCTSISRPFRDDMCNTKERGGSEAKSILRLLNNLSGYTGSIEATGVVWEIVLAMADGAMRIGLKRGLKNGKGGFRRGDDGQGGFDQGDDGSGDFICGDDMQSVT